MFVYICPVLVLYPSCIPEKSGHNPKRRKLKIVFPPEIRG
jgi:hypothetical protein